MSAVTYNAFGAPLNDMLGANARTESRTYTLRGWWQTLSTLQGATQRYNFSLTFAPNGDILTGNDSANGNWTMTLIAFLAPATICFDISGEHFVRWMGSDRLVPISAV